MKWMPVEAPTPYVYKPRKFAGPLPAEFEDYLAQMESHIAACREDEYQEEQRLWTTRWNARQELTALESKFANGHKLAVLMALSLCIEYELPIPDWAAGGFLVACNTVERYESNSWDELFGKPYGKGAQLAAMRKKRDKSRLIYSEVFDLHEAGRAIDESLFEEVGRRHAMGKTLSAELYYEYKAAIDGF